MRLVRARARSRPAGAATTNFNLASNTQDVTIAKATPTVTFNTAPTPTYLGGDFTVSATTNSGGALSYGFVSGPCAVVSATLGTFSSSGAGTCVVSASAAPTTNFNAGSASPNQSVTIAKANQATLTVNAGSPLTFNDTENPDHFGWQRHGRGNVRCDGGQLLGVDRSVDGQQRFRNVFGNSDKSDGQQL